MFSLFWRRLPSSCAQSQRIYGFLSDCFASFDSFNSFSVDSFDFELAFH